MYVPVKNDGFLKAIPVPLLVQCTSYEMVSIQGVCKYVAIHLYVKEHTV